MSRFVSVTPNLFVTDMARAVAFYRDVLGFAIKLTVPDEAPHVFAWMTHGDVTLFLNDLATVQHDLSEAAPRDRDRQRSSSRSRVWMRSTTRSPPMPDGFSR